MAIVEMSKAQVIEVLKREPLTHGAYAENHARDDIEVGSAADRSCSMCAVGQVVRAAMSTRASAWQVNMQSLGGPDSQHWCDLSDAFEDVRGARFGVVDDGRGRRAAIAHVRKHFPARIRIDIGDAKPRRGMRVVKP